MLPTLALFSQALLLPDLLLRTLKQAVASCDHGLPCICRTARFAEAEITWHGERWLLCAPLTTAAIDSAERFAAQARRINSPCLPDYRLLPGELCQGEQCYDLLLQQLPQGTPLTELIGQTRPELLLQTLQALQTEMQRIGLTHNNIKAENIIVTGHGMSLIRCHYARLGGDSADDQSGFARLRAQITATQAEESLPEMPDFQGRLRGHLWVGNLFEQLICVQDTAGYGYVDRQNRVVIAPQFRWADDFHEGRAAVETSTGMGLIDKTGRYVIPPEYQIVEYDPEQGISHVRLNDQWSELDYEGCPIDNN